MGASQIFFGDYSAEFHAIALRPVAPGARVILCTMRCTGRPAGNERAAKMVLVQVHVEELG